jgi:hypothetical protein
MPGFLLVPEVHSHDLGFGETMTTVEAPLWACLLLLLPAAIWLWWLDLRRPKPGRCAACGYDLRGLQNARCPECGRPFDLAGVGINVEELQDVDTEHGGDNNKEEP